MEMDSALKLKFRKPVLSFSLDGEAVHLAPTTAWSFVLFQRAEPLYLNETWYNGAVRCPLRVSRGFSGKYAVT